MVLDRLEISNFRVFRGSNTIDFSPPGDRRVTVLIGENQAGKTTLIHAIRWCLYGESPGMVNPEDLLSHYELSRARIGETLKVFVMLRFEHENIVYRARRERAYKKIDGGVPKEVGRDFTVHAMEKHDGSLTDVSDPQSRIIEIIPQSMAPFFFFEGEAAKAWATTAGGEQLRRGVQDCLDVSVLDRAVRHLEKAHEVLRKENRPLSGEAEDIDRQIKDLESERDENRARLAEERRELAALERQKLEYEAELSKYAESAPLVADLKTLREKAKGDMARLSETEAQLKRFIGKEGFLAFLAKPVASTRAMLTEAYKRDQIPSRIKPGFVDELLNRGTCICDASLAEGSSNKAALLKWKDLSGLGDLSERLAVIENKVSELEARKARNFDEASAEFNRLRDARAAVLAEIHRTGGAIKDLEEKLAGKEFNDSVVAELQAKRNEAEADARGKMFDIGDLERALGEGRHKDEASSIAVRLENLEKRYKDQQKNNAQSRLLVKKMERIERVKNAVARLHEGWLSIVQEYLDEEAKRSYTVVGQLNRRVAVSKSFVLSIEREVEGRWIADAPSEANQGVMALCFTSAFVDLAKRLNEDTDSTAAYFQGGQFPMVMDAPFSDWDAHFCRTVSSHLADTVPQLIVITKHRDWPEAKSVLEGKVGRAYVVRFFGQNAAGKSVEFLGKHTEYSVKDVDADPEYTMIAEVK
jgi:DNA sulfur modification protein DndD